MLPYPKIAGIRNLTKTTFLGQYTEAKSDRQSSQFIIPATVVVDDGDVIIPNVQFLAVTIWVTLSVGHQGGNVKKHCNIHRP